MAEHVDPIRYLAPSVAKAERWLSVHIPAPRGVDSIQTDVPATTHGLINNDLVVSDFRCFKTVESSTLRMQKLVTDRQQYVSAAVDPTMRLPSP